MKYSYFHKEQKRSYQNNAFLTGNLYYNEQADYFVCPMGQHMTLAGKHSHKTESGYRTQIHVYQAQRCTSCPLHGQCHKSKGNRRIEVNHTLRAYKKKARELLTSEEGLRHRSCRSIEPEAVFGQMKADKYYKRFRHFGKDNISMDFAIFAIAFNIGKAWNKGQNAKNSERNQPKNQHILYNLLLMRTKSRLAQTGSAQYLFFTPIAA